jgi:altronate hydrolase
MQTQYIKINSEDNVAVAISALPAGSNIRVGEQEILLLQDIPAGHKFALKNFAANEFIVKYGYAIGHAREDIQVGTWVNEKNIKTNLDGVLEYTYSPKLVYPDISNQNLTFNGYLRANGSAGVRNEIWLIPTVGCVNGTINQLAEQLRRETNGVGVDAIVAFPHN